MGEDLQELSDLVDERKLTVEVARTFPLEGAADAYRLNMDGHTRGKIVVTIDSPIKPSGYPGRIYFRPIKEVSRYNGNETETVPAVNQIEVHPYLTREEHGRALNPEHGIATEARFSASKFSRTGLSSAATNSS